MSQPDVIALLKKAKENNNHFTFLVGAGLSAESGIPTFRGEDGYWVIGSKNYHPQEMATRQMFTKHPKEVWEWYLSRIKAYGKSIPNEGHYALVEFEKHLQGQFSLVSQNVDGLNLKAGNSIDHFYPIHGDLTFIRCFNECSDELYKIRDFFNPEEEITKETFDRLVCPKCKGITRPHVLWFDEAYDEKFYRLNSVLEIAEKTDVLFTIGTTGTTSLPHHIFQTALQNRTLIIDINPDDTIFSQVLYEYDNGFVIREKSGSALPKILKRMKI
mgnify:CR=1 FL=1